MKVHRLVMYNIHIHSYCFDTSNAHFPEAMYNPAPKMHLLLWDMQEGPQGELQAMIRQGPRTIRQEPRVGILQYHILVCTEQWQRQQKLTTSSCDAPLWVGQWT